MQFQANSVVNFAPWAIIPSSQQLQTFCDSAAIILLILRQDPKNTSSGSSSSSPGLRGTRTQYVPLRQLRFLLYVVFLPRSVTARPVPENAALLIP
ncbi:hypothetical protein FOT48_00585 [Citrobacter koseri]|nr:hypothetical protein [Citrobacter koseri]MBE0080326.1 hypothetical protein [Citrobacter koseri]